MHSAKPARCLERELHVSIPCLEAQRKADRSARPRLSSRVSWPSKLALVLLGVLLSGLLLEAGLRIAANWNWGHSIRALVANPRTNPEMQETLYDPDVGFVRNPKSPVRWPDINSDGLRDRPVRPKDSLFRVLFLGDSVAVWGDTVDDTLIGQVRSVLLRNPAFGRVDILNGAVAGYTNYQELAFLKKYELKFQPDLVGVEFCLNDLHKYLHTFEIENGQIVPARFPYLSEEKTPRGVNRSWLSRLARKSLLILRINDMFRVAAPHVNWKIHGGFSFDYNFDVRNAWKDEPWREIEDQLREMMVVGRENHFGVFLLVVPLAVQYNPEYLARDREYVLKPQRKIREICTRLQVPFYDLYPDVDEHLFLEEGVHLNQAGRQQAGQRVAAFLADSKLLPTTGSTPNGSSASSPD